MQPVIDNGFTNWDDPGYVAENVALQKGDLRALTREYFVGHFHPLTMLSYALDMRMGGGSPRSFHVTSLVLHVIASILAFLFVEALAGSSIAAFVAAVLFAVHPMHVEPVAWIASRKDLLESLFFLLGLWIYVLYLRRGTRSVALYSLALIAFVAACLSKAMAVTFPIVLFLIDWVLRRPNSVRMWLEKVPMLAVSVVVGLVAIRAQESAQAIASSAVPMVTRLGFVSYGIVQYIAKLLVPVKLAVFYPYPPARSPLVMLAPILLLIAGGVVMWSLRRTRLIAFAFGFFLIIVAPVLQIMAVGMALIADRYTYLSYLGFFILIGAGLERALARWPRRSAALIGVSAVVALVLIGASRARAAVWHDSLSLWNDELSKFPEAAQGYNMRAREWVQRGDFDRALPDLERAIALEPALPNPWINRGNIRGLRGDYEGSLADLTKAAEIAPAEFDAHFNRGITLQSMKRYEEAVAALTRALELKPGEAKAWFARAACYSHWGKHREAIADFSRGLTLDPDNPMALDGRGVAAHNAGDYAAALRDFDRYVALRPNDPSGPYKRSVAQAALQAQGVK